MKKSIFNPGELKRYEPVTSIKNGVKIYFDKLNIFEIEVFPKSLNAVKSIRGIIIQQKRKNNIAVKIAFTPTVKRFPHGLSKAKNNAIFNIPAIITISAVLSLAKKIFLPR